MPFVMASAMMSEATPAVTPRTLMAVIDADNGLAAAWRARYRDRDEEFETHLAVRVLSARQIKANPACFKQQIGESNWPAPRDSGPGLLLNPG